MTTCAACGQGLPEADPPTWSFVIERKVPSLDEHLLNIGAARHAYRRNRESWAMCFTDAMGSRGIPDARGKRRARFTRLYSGLEREREHTALVGGFAVVRDAMFVAGLVISNDIEGAEYSQRRGDVTGLLVELWTEVHSKPDPAQKRGGMGAV